MSGTRKQSSVLALFPEKTLVFCFLFAWLNATFYQERIAGVATDVLATAAYNFFSGGREVPGVAG